MPKKKSKLKGVTFQLVHRSQQDPLIVDETAPQRVLVPVPDKQFREDRTDEQHKYGIYFDDDYDYLKYLKDVKNNHMEWPSHVEEELEERRKAKIQLASSVFASDVQEEVGMLNKAAPVSGLQLDLDSDVVAAMDDDFDYDNPENQLEDNFIQLAEGVASDDEFSYNSDDEDIDTISESGLSFSKEETKSRFTNYSMTSSVIRRNEQLTLLDRRFEKMFEQYDDSEIGALDETVEEEDSNKAYTDLLSQYAEEFERDHKREQLKTETNGDVVNKTKKLLEVLNEEISEDERSEEEKEEEEKWDCQTILSTYSNTQNLPKLIEVPSCKKKITVNKHTGIPVDSNKLTTKALNRFNEDNVCPVRCVKGPRSTAESVMSQLSVLSIRPKNETPEDRRDRKNALKEYRRERRKERKINTLAFREYSKQQSKIAMNSRNNVQGNRLL
ncbi:hypothetical protein ABEB36_006220 [Hypothenemus hampei]|uniref:Protein LTV1 homolog n=1 Tax=Hypothenemus hampei TaxID=57062 RepID=A0ABD1EPT7_HYPHA